MCTESSSSSGHESNPRLDSRERKWTLADINWQNLLTLTTVHILAVWGLYRSLFYGTYRTLAFAYLLGMPFFCFATGLTRPIT